MRISVSQTIQIHYTPIGQLTIFVAALKNRKILVYKSPMQPFKMFHVFNVRTVFA